MNRLGEIANLLIDSIVTSAGLVPFAGMILVVLFVRNTRATEEGPVRVI